MINKDTIIDALEEIDDEFIKEALSYGNDEEKDMSSEIKKKNRREVVRSIFKITAVAACITLIVLLKQFTGISMEMSSKGSSSGGAGKSDSNGTVGASEPSPTPISCDLGGGSWEGSEGIDIADEDTKSNGGSFGGIDPENIKTFDDIIYYKPYIELLHNGIEYKITEMYNGEDVDYAKSLLDKKLDTICSYTEYKEDNNK